MKHLSLIASALAVLGLAACEKSLDGMEDGVSSDGGQVKNAVLQVRTRAGGSTSDGAAVAYPVTVYVFAGEECKSAQTIGDEGQTLNIALTEGTYSVYAVGGASSEGYALPTASDALTTSAIALREGKSHGDLMAATATATLVDGGTNTVTLGMERKTMLIQSVTISKVPTAATAVSVTIAPLWQSLTVGGTFSGASSSQTIALTRQSDNRTWTATPDVHLLPPSSQPASVSVNITIGGTTKTYTYSTSDQLEAGYKISIEGTYTEAVGVSLTGTIEGATWKGERTIRFDFDEKGSTEHTEGTEGTENGGGSDSGGSSSEGTDPTPDPSPSGAGSFPSAGDTYQGCYVLAATVSDDSESAELTLLSPNEQGSQVPSTITLSDLQNTAATLGTDDISDWRPMTRSEAKLLQAVHTTLGIADAALYLFDDNGTVKQMQMGNGNVNYPSGLTTAIVRPVATVSITKD